MFAIVKVRQARTTTWESWAVKIHPVNPVALNYLLEGGMGVEIAPIGEDWKEEEIKK